MVPRASHANFYVVVKALLKACVLTCSIDEYDLIASQTNAYLPVVFMRCSSWRYRLMRTYLQYICVSV